MIRQEHARSAAGLGVVGSQGARPAGKPGDRQVKPGADSGQGLALASPGAEPGKFWPVLYLGLERGPFLQPVSLQARSDPAVEVSAAGLGRPSSCGASGA